MPSRWRMQRLSWRTERLTCRVISDCQPDCAIVEASGGVLRYTHTSTPLDDSTRPLDNSTNSTIHNPQRAGALVTSIFLDGGPHGWVPVDTHSTPVLPKPEEAVGSSTSTTPEEPKRLSQHCAITTWYRSTQRSTARSQPAQQRGAKR